MKDLDAAMRASDFEIVNEVTFREELLQDFKSSSFEQGGVRYRIPEKSIKLEFIGKVNENVVVPESKEEEEETTQWSGVLFSDKIRNLFRDPAPVVCTDEQELWLKSVSKMQGDIAAILKK